MFKPERTKVIKTLLVSCALIIAAGSLFVSNALIADLKSEEQARVGVWAEAMQSFMRADENTDLNLVLRIINSNHTIPVILLDEQNHVIDYRNITFSASTDTTAYLASEARAMREGGHSMQLSIDNMPGHFTLCYGESTMLKRLAVYPYIQLAVVGLFFILAVSILLSSKKYQHCSGSITGGCMGWLSASSMMSKRARMWLATSLNDCSNLIPYCCQIPSSTIC